MTLLSSLLPAAADATAVSTPFKESDAIEVVCREGGVPRAAMLLREEGGEAVVVLGGFR